MGVCTSSPEDLSNSSRGRKKSQGHPENSSLEVTGNSPLMSPTCVPGGAAPGFTTPPYSTNYLPPNYSGAARVNRYHNAYSDSLSNQGPLKDPLMATLPYGSPNPTTTMSGSEGLSPLPLTGLPSNRTPIPLNIAVSQPASDEPPLPMVPPAAAAATRRLPLQDGTGDDVMSTTAMSLDNYSYFDSQQVSPARQLSGRSSATGSTNGGDGHSMTSEYSMQAYMADRLFDHPMGKHGTRPSPATAPNSSTSSNGRTMSSGGLNISTHMNGLMAAAAAHKGSKPPSETASQSSTALSVDDNFINLCKRENLNDVNISELNDQLHMKLVAGGLAGGGPYKYTSSANTAMSSRRATVPHSEGDPTSLAGGNAGGAAGPTGQGMRRRAVSFLGEMR